MFSESVCIAIIFLTDSAGERSGRILLLIDSELMLAVSPPSRSKDEIESSQREMEGLAVVGDDDDGDFAQFSDGSLLESIDFDNLFVGIGDDVLPGLEMDPELLAEFSVVSGGEESSEMNSSSSIVVENINNNSSNDDNNQNMVMTTEKEEGDNNNKVSLDSGSGLSDSNCGDEREKVKASTKKAKKGRKSCAQSKDSQGKRKVKVDWTAELHRRFVKAVEQLGVEKAVPSRILEIMGIGSLTRHNIASHLQKYRSHKKHMAEAARHQILYGHGGRVGKAMSIRHWGFPPQMPAPPFHVWGHPSNIPIPICHHPPPLLPPHPLFWNQQAPNAATPPHSHYYCTHVPAIPPHSMVKVDHGIYVSGQPVFYFHPSKESIDAAIEDVLSKPWLPLPLGLKAPTLDGVLGELQRQGIPNILPSCA